MQLTSTKEMSQLLTSKWLLFFEWEDGGHVSHPPLYSWEDVLFFFFLIHFIYLFFFIFVCQLTSVLTGVVCAVYVCQIHLSTWKCWKTHSSPVFDKSYYKHVLAHTFKKKEKKKKKRRKFFFSLSPISKQQSTHFKQACFITTIIIKYKPTWSINYS